MSCKHKKLSWEICYTVEGEQETRSGSGTADEALHDMDTLHQNGVGTTVAQIVCPTCRAFITWDEVQDISDSCELTVEDYESLLENVQTAWCFWEEKGEEDWMLNCDSLQVKLKKILEGLK